MSKLNLVLFDTLSPQKYAAEKRFFIDNNAGNIAERLVTFQANAVGHAMIHGDPTHANYVLQASKLGNNKVAGKFRETKRIMQPILGAWPYDTKAQKFDGKADKAKLDKLRESVTIDGKTAPRWEFLLYEAIHAEKKQEEAAEKAPWDCETDVQRRFNGFARQAKSNGMTNAEIKETWLKVAV